MTIHPIRKLIQRLGFDLHRYRPIPDKLAWLRRCNIRTVIDVGANVGQFAAEIRAILPDALIYSFEPLPDCYQQLIKNMAGDQKFKAFNIALGDQDGEMMIHHSQHEPSSSILEMTSAGKAMFPHTVENSPERIVVKRLDDFAELLVRPEVLLKIDTEGYEAKVLAGGQKALSQVRTIIIENSYLPRYQCQALFADIYSTLTAAGFRYRGAWQQKLNPTTGEIIFEDSIFLR